MCMNSLQKYDADIKVAIVDSLSAVKSLTLQELQLLEHQEYLFNE